jgi:hypothetical protein
MGKGNTATKHHCVGDHAWIGDISPGGCREVKVGGLIYCDKHEMPCRNGCIDWQHLKNQEGCMACRDKWMAEARRARSGAAKKMGAVMKEKEDAFWKEGKERKKPRAQVKPGVAKASSYLVK